MYFYLSDHLQLSPLLQGVLLNPSISRYIAFLWGSINLKRIVCMRATLSVMRIVDMPLLAGHFL
jgi:hypothetical protein